LILFYTGCEISELVVEHKRHKEEGWERDLSDELEGIEVKKQTANAKQCHSRLSPLTPLIQSSMYVLMLASMHA